MLVKNASLPRRTAVLLCGLFLIASSHVGHAASIPTDNLELWLDAADPNGDNSPAVPGAVATWVDKSGNSRDASQATVGNQPTMTTGAAGINGIPVVRFDGNDGTNSDWLGNTTVTYNAKTVFIAYRVDNTHHGLGQLWGQYNGSGHVAGRQGTGAWSFDGNSGKRASYGLNGAALTPYYTGGEDSTQPWIYNESQIITAVFEGASGISLTDQYVGTLTPSHPVASHNYGGDIAEILVYSDLLDATEIAQVRAYLGGKWAIAVPEPSTLAMLLGLGGVGLLGWMRRRRRS